LGSFAATVALGGLLSVIVSRSAAKIVETGRSPPLRMRRGRRINSFPFPFSLPGRIIRIDYSLTRRRSSSAEFLMEFHAAAALVSVVLNQLYIP